MIKGERQYIEEEIQTFVQSGDFAGGIYRTELDLSCESAPNLLYLGYAKSSRPSFLFGICSLLDGQGMVIMTRNFKPAAYIAGFTRIVQQLFPQSPDAVRRRLVGRFCGTYAAMLGSEGVSSEQLAAFQDHPLASKLQFHPHPAPNAVDQP